MISKTFVDAHMDNIFSLYQCFNTINWLIQHMNAPVLRYIQRFDIKPGEICVIQLLTNIEMKETSGRNYER